MPSVIALDAMGSDRRPKPEIEGAVQAARHYDVHVLLVGPEPALRVELARYPAAAGLPIDVVHASEVIGMEDKAVQAVRAKRDSSMRVGLRLVRDRRAAARPRVAAAQPGLLPGGLRTGGAPVLRPGRELRGRGGP